MSAPSAASVQKRASVLAVLLRTAPQISNRRESASRAVHAGYASPALNSLSASTPSLASSLSTRAGSFAGSRPSESPGRAASVLPSGADISMCTTLRPSACDASLVRSRLALTSAARGALFEYLPSPATAATAAARASACAARAALASAASSHFRGALTATAGLPGLAALFPPAPPAGVVAFVERSARTFLRGSQRPSVHASTMPSMPSTSSASALG
mmetsp:Transcript_15280/g.63467  ORF Transcript_15280/g.63467 Transcript_15280/m.63467 type:complete len:217 (+) Transcript_15280:832-1482(+)